MNQRWKEPTMAKTSDHVDLLNKLTDGIANLASSPAWRDYLRAQGRFHDYSFNNTMFIAQQCSTTTKVAGFRTWSGLGRHVMRGEMAIRIVAPVIYCDSSKDDDPESKSLHGFRNVPVFGIAQAEATISPGACAKHARQEPARCSQALVNVAAAHAASTACIVTRTGLSRSRPSILVLRESKPWFMNLTMHSFTRTAAFLSPSSKSSQPPMQPVKPSESTPVITPFAVSPSVLPLHRSHCENQGFSREDSQNRFKRPEWHRVSHH